MIMPFNLYATVSSLKLKINQQHLFTIQIDNDGTLDKEATSYNDIFDAYSW
jgi:hypothetical protein